ILVTPSSQIPGARHSAVIASIPGEQTIASLRNIYCQIDVREGSCAQRTRHVAGHAKANVEPSETDDRSPDSLPAYKHPIRTVAGGGVVACNRRAAAEVVSGLHQA